MQKRKNSERSAGKNLSRHAKMDAALALALATKVPDKDTGPDPDDILNALVDEEAGPENNQTAAGNKRRYTIELDEAERERGEQILRLIQRATGEHKELGDALRVALLQCPLDEQVIAEAFKQLSSRR